MTTNGCGQMDSPPRVIGEDPKRHDLKKQLLQLRYLNPKPQTPDPKLQFAFDFPFSLYNPS